MKAKKSASNKSSQRTSPKDVLLLSVEVLRFGEVQFSETWRLSRFFKKTLTFGSSLQADISIPYSNLIKEIDLFIVGRNRCELLVNEQFDGFINTGKRFADISDFVNPPAALSRLATFDEPLEVEIHKGGRASLKYHGYQILCKVTKLNQRIPSQVSLGPGASGGAFNLPVTNSPIENWAIPIAFVSTIAMAIPAVLWLLKAPRENYVGLESLPAHQLIQLIHPSHFQILPAVYGEDFSFTNPVPQAIFWVSELQKRWQSEELGKPYDSSLDVLRGHWRDQYPHATVKRWQEKTREFYRKIDAKQQSKLSPRFVQLQRQPPRFTLETSGGLQGSIGVRQFRRLERLDKTQVALRSLVEAEYGFLKGYFDKKNIKMEGVLDAPRAGFVTLSAADPEYAEEKARFARAQEYANMAAESPFRSYRQDTSADEKDSGMSDKRTSIVWVKPESGVVPKSMLGTLRWKQSEPQALVSNAKYALGLKKLPPLPTPKPSIDENEVELFILGRNEEIKTCYDASLRRDPSTEGFVKWRWTINELGRVEQIGVSDTNLEDKELLKCVQNRISTWRFPRPQNGRVVVTYPFEFVVKVAR